MQAEHETKRRTEGPRPESTRQESSWREAADLLRFSAEAAIVSGAIVLAAWFLTGHG